jgi:hypothetical protein
MRLWRLEDNLELGRFASRTSSARSLHGLGHWVGGPQRFGLVDRAHVLGEGIGSGKGPVTLCRKSQPN